MFFLSSLYGDDTLAKGTKVERNSSPTEKGTTNSISDITIVLRTATHTYWDPSTDRNRENYNWYAVFVRGKRLHVSDFLFGTWLNTHWYKCAHSFVKVVIICPVLLADVYYNVAYNVVYINSIFHMFLLRQSFIFYLISSLRNIIF